MRGPEIRRNLSTSEKRKKGVMVNNTKVVRLLQAPTPSGEGPGHWKLADNEMSYYWVSDDDDDVYLDPPVGGWDPPGHHFPELKEAGK